MSTIRGRFIAGLWMLSTGIATCHTCLPASAFVYSVSSFGRDRFSMPTLSTVPWTASIKSNSSLRLQERLKGDGGKSIKNDPDTHMLSIVSFGATAPLKVASRFARDFLKLITREIKSLTFHQKVFFVSTFLTGFVLGRLWPFWKRYTNVNDVPSKTFGKGVLRGRAITVSDGDTIRFLHQPTFWYPSQLRKGEKSSEVALPIRICTIDTPETAKFGKSGQPFGEEAKQHLKKLLQDKSVYIRLLQRDQYSRGVAQVFTKRFPFFWRERHVDAEMIKEGLAEVYTGGGAVYGPLGREEYLVMETKAQKAKKGIWSQKNRETAAEYKKRTKG